jgi:hypothetical protein
MQGRRAQAAQIDGVEQGGSAAALRPEIERKFEAICAFWGNCLLCWSRIFMIASRDTVVESIFAGVILTLQWQAD